MTRPDPPLPAAVRTLRTRALLSQEELAQRAGLSIGTIRGIEAGRITRPRSGSIRRLADVLTHNPADRERFLASARRESSPAFVAPAQLPLEAAGFAGRDTALRRLDEALAHLGGDRPVIAVVTGTGGIGKTTLAVHWAHRAAPNFPDGQVYLNLRGFGPGMPAMSSDEALRTLLEQLQVPAERIPATADARAGLYRSLLADRRLLVVLDNARDAQHVRSLIPGAGGSAALVTSRDQLLGLVTESNAAAVRLTALNPAESRMMLTERLGSARVGAEPDAVNTILSACGGLPLALAVVAARALTRPEFDLDVFAEELSDSRGALDALSCADAATDVRTVLSWSYDALDDETARLFRLLGLHSGPDIGIATAASLAGHSVHTTRRLLTRLTSAHLISEPSPGRYSGHDLVLAYAAELASAIDTADERHAALLRMIDHYLHSAGAADRRLEAGRDPVDLGQPADGAIPIAFTDTDSARSWFDSERQALLALVQHTADGRFDRRVQRLAQVLGTYLLWSGLWQEQLTVQQAGLAAARRRADRIGQADLYRRLAHACVVLGHGDEAEEHIQDALELSRAAGDDTGRARAHLAMTWMSERIGRYDDALAHAQQCLAAANDAGHSVMQALARNAIGWSHSLLGDHHKAIAYCEQALSELEQAGDKANLTDIWDSLGHAHHHLGNHLHAAKYFQQAIEQCRETGDVRHEATIQIHLGDTWNAAGDATSARAAWQRALEILDQSGHPDVTTVRGRLAASADQADSAAGSMPADHPV